MKKFRDLSDRIQTLIIALIVITSMVGTIIIFGFCMYMNIDIGEDIKELTAAPFPKVYETVGPFKKYDILESEREDIGRDVAYEYIRLIILSDEEAARFEDAVKKAGEWQPISSLSPDEIEILVWLGHTPTGYFIANSRPIGKTEIKFASYDPDTREIIYLYSY